MSRIFSVMFVLSALLVCSVGSSRIEGQTSGTEQGRRGERRIRALQQRQEAIFQGKAPKGTATVVGRSIISSVDKGFGDTIALLEAANNTNLSKEIGFSTEQTAQLKSARDELRMQLLFKSPKYIERFKSMSEADHEAVQKDLEKELQSMTDRISNIATPEQKARVQKLTFQAMGGLDSPIINKAALSPLNLSEEQKKKMEGTFKMMEQERVAQMEEGLRLVEKALERGGIDMSDEDRRAIEAEGRALQARIIATGKKLGDGLRSHLTSEQRALEKDLMADRPSFLPRLPRQLRGDFTRQYTPGFDSWAPGQGVPKEEGTSKRQRRPFPTKE